jgi:hypothetical protein
MRNSLTKNQHIFTLGISTKKKHTSMLLMAMEIFLAITKLGKRNLVCLHKRGNVLCMCCLCTVEHMTHHLLIL